MSGAFWLRSRKRRHRGSASLKEWGRVKEMVGSKCRLRAMGGCVRAGVVGGAGVKAGRRPPGGLALTPASDDADLSSGPDGRRGAGVGVGVGVSHRGPHDLRWQRGSAAEASLRRRVASMVRSGHDKTGFKQFVDLAARCGGHADHELASGRVRVSRRLGLGEAADLAIAQAVVDEREDLAGHRHPRLVRAAPFGEAPKPRSQGGSAVI